MIGTQENLFGAKVTKFPIAGFDFGGADVAARRASLHPLTPPARIPAVGFVGTS